MEMYADYEADWGATECYNQAKSGLRVNAYRVVSEELHEP